MRILEIKNSSNGSRSEVELLGSYKDLVTLHDLTLKDFEEIFEQAKALKDKQKAREPHELLKNRTICTIYEKPSLRTRVSFETAMVQLGGHAIYMKAIPGWKMSDAHLKEGDEDLAIVLSRYVDGIVARVFEHSKVENLAKYATIPVINALTDLTHPCQTLADLLTILERKKKLKDLTMAFIGDGGSNMAHSSLLGATKVGMDIRVASPENSKYRPDPKILSWAEKAAEESGSEVTILKDPRKAAKDADVIYTDVWISMGQEEEMQERLTAFKGFKVDQGLVNFAKDDCMVLHCLPRTKYEISEEVAKGNHSAIYDEAENRLHVQKAILSLLIE